MTSAGATNSVVMGLGVTGLSCVRHLAARGDRLCVMDSREAPPGLEELRRDHPGVELVLGGFPEAALEAADLVAVSPGIPAQDPLLVRARARGTDVVGDVELFARAARGPVAGITGTNGKSTVTSLLGTLLREAGRDVAVGGNLGTPALDLLARAPRDGFVLELSSFQLELVERIDLACASILNLSPDHLDRYGDLESYGAAKQRIYRHAAAAVFNADDVHTHPPAAFPGRRVAVRVGPPRGPEEWGVVADRDGSLRIEGPGGFVLAADGLPVAGRHNAFNVAAALAMADVLGVPPATAVSGLAAWRPLPHRCVPVARAGAVRFVNDSKATNVGACRAALDGLATGARDLVVILGGQGKGQDFTLLREPLARTARAVVLLGEDADTIARAVQGCCAVERAADLDEAVRLAHALARPAGTVLLAPACASFDRFRSYADRGERFVAAVDRLLREGTP